MALAMVCDIAREHGDMLFSRCSEASSWGLPESQDPIPNLESKETVDLTQWLSTGFKLSLLVSEHRVDASARLPALGSPGIRVSGFAAPDRGVAGPFEHRH